MYSKDCRKKLFFLLLIIRMFLTALSSYFLTALGLAFWASPIGLKYVVWDGTKGTNKALAPIGLRLIWQLLTSPKLPLIIWQVPLWKYNCTLGLINKLFPKTLIWYHLTPPWNIHNEQSHNNLSLCKKLFYSLSSQFNLLVIHIYEI